MLYDSSINSIVPTLASTNYDAVVVALAIRTLLNEACPEGPDLLFSRGIPDELKAKYILDCCVSIIHSRLEMLRDKLGDLPIFLFSFLEPSFSYFGRFHYSDTLCEPAGFVRALNSELKKYLRK